MSNLQPSPTKSALTSAGKHILIDFWGSEGLQDAAFIEKAMRRAADVCGATVLNVNLHEFGGGGGITGAAILAESHITVHTWPEIGLVALDVFMCGDCDPVAAILPLEKMFRPAHSTITTFYRGAR